MFSLKTGYLVSGIIVGIFVLVGFFTSLPDGRLHLIFCNVGQGDAAYIRFPDGRDMLMDGGPDNKVIDCLSRHSPFWDRVIDIVALSHPQKDHLAGLIPVLERYKVNYFAYSNVSENTVIDKKLQQLIKVKKIPEKLLVTGNIIDEGTTTISVIWPSESQITISNPKSGCKASGTPCDNVLSASTSNNVNDASLVLHLRYGTFDALFMGDADSRVDDKLIRETLDAPDAIEVLKVPHHGSRTGMTDGFLDWVFSIRKNSLLPIKNTINQSPFISRVIPDNTDSLAIISVGKNTYGHPAVETLNKLLEYNIEMLRTDKMGDIEVISDGNNYRIITQK
jgi:competence protein ComEC